MEGASYSINKFWAEMWLSRSICSLYFIIGKTRLWIFNHVEDWECYIEAFMRQETVSRFVITYR